MSEENQNKQPDLAAELAKIQAELEASKQTAAAAKQESEEARSFMEGIQKAASGHREEAPKKPQETFVDNILTQGDKPVRSLVQEELQKQAYFNTLTDNFRKQNPHLVAMQDEIFGKTNQIIQAAQAQGQNISWEAALDTSTKHYDEKYKSMMKVAGANASPGGNFGMPSSRYQGCDEDYFAMSDAEFIEKVDRPREAARKKRAREFLGHYGVGR